MSDRGGLVKPKVAISKKRREKWEETQGSTEFDGTAHGVELGVWVNPKGYAR
jgi:hypothetical protein